MPTTVINIKQAPPGWKNNPKYQYIGREPFGMHFGNPFSHLSQSRASVKVGSRDEAVAAFKEWLSGHAYNQVEPGRRLWILHHLADLGDKILVCFCHPQACHGDVYASIMNNIGEC